ncbi:hypothetical protein BS78_05G121000 [Paspalum vaginatum]|nr:hypothetical protein BS78_05G121000 [Paspalum vaginatum]
MRPNDLSQKYKLGVTRLPSWTRTLSHLQHRLTNASPRSVQGYSNGKTAMMAHRGAARDGLAHRHSAFTPWSPRALVSPALSPRQPTPSRTTLFPTLRSRQPRPADLCPQSPAAHTLADLPPWSPQVQGHHEQVSSSRQEAAAAAAMAAAQDGPAGQHYVILPWSSMATWLPVSSPAQQCPHCYGLLAPVMISPAFMAPPPTSSTELQQARPPSPGSASKTAYDGRRRLGDSRLVRSCPPWIY